MSPSVKLSLKAARVLSVGGTDSWAVMELRAAIARAERQGATRRKLAKPKQDRRARRMEETKALRDRVMLRAGGICEAPGCASWSRQLQLDHFRGRGKAKQALENCWALCFSCHCGKTNNKPSAHAWLLEFQRHCERHGYSNEWAWADKRLTFVEARAGIGGAP